MKTLSVLALTTALATAAQAQTYTESILYNFGSSKADGRSPNGGLVTQTGGYLYGTTTFGGRANDGVVFKLVNGKETILHTFVGETDGAYPSASLAKE